MRITDDLIRLTKAERMAEIAAFVEQHITDTVTSSIESGNTEFARMRLPDYWVIEPESDEFRDFERDFMTKNPAVHGIQFLWRTYQHISGSEELEYTGSFLDFALNPRQPGGLERLTARLGTAFSAVSTCFRERGNTSRCAPANPEP